MPRIRSRRGVRRQSDPQVLGRPDSRHPAPIRHVATAAVAAVLIAGFWLGRLDWDPTMRLWRAFGDASIVLLFASLFLGPAARLWRRFGRILPWRREIGVWSAVTALVHTVLVLDGWVQWDPGRLMGYEFVAELDRTLRLEPGFGLANLIGLVAVAWILVLAATSSDWAMRTLGHEAWKWIHQGAHVIFYLAVLHAAYFLFIHYTASFHREPPSPNWFRWPLLVMGITVAALQWMAFVKTARRRRLARLQRERDGIGPSGGRPVP